MIISHQFYITFTGYLFYCIYFKILIVRFKAIYNLSPSYISNLWSCSVYSLRSNSSIFLDRPKGRMLSTLGARCFYAAAPTLWNSLPANIREITSLSIFKKKLEEVALGGAQLCTFRFRFH